MADFKVSDLPLADPVTGTELMEVVQGGVSKKAVMGTAATKGVATNAQAIAGTAGVLPDAAGVHAAIGHVGLGGAAQSWQDVTDSRAFSTTYINSTGKPIAISLIKANNNNDNNEIQILVSGVIVWKLISNHGGTANSAGFAIVPSGATYSASGYPAGVIWMELR